MRLVRRWSAAVAIVTTLVLIAAIGLHYGGVDLEPLLVSTGFRQPHRTDLSHDFDFNHFHYDVKVEPQSNRLTCDGTLSLTAKKDDARSCTWCPCTLTGTTSPVISQTYRPVLVRK